jgi:hypothetical protein
MQATFRPLPSQPKIRDKRQFELEMKPINERDERHYTRPKRSEFNLHARAPAASVLDEVEFRLDPGQYSRRGLRHPGICRRNADSCSHTPARRRRGRESRNSGRKLVPPKTRAEPTRGRFHWGRGRRRPKLAARAATGPIRPISREIAAKNSGCLRFFGRGPIAAPRPCWPLTAAPCARRPTTRPPLTLGNVTGQRRPPSRAGCCKTTANGWVASRVSFYLSIGLPRPKMD